MRDEILKAVAILKEGGVILYPTDTIWGIGCDASNEAAIKKVYEIKKRSEAKSLIALVDPGQGLPTCLAVDQILTKNVVTVRGILQTIQ